MPRNSSGTYTLPTGNPVTSGSLISTTWANDTLSDIATALTDSLSRSGNGGLTGPFALVDGTVAAPALNFTTDPQTGLYKSAAGTLAVSSLGSNVVTFAPTGMLVAGTLTVNGAMTVQTPTAASNPTTKSYVDSADATLTTAVNGKVAKAGDTMTGFLTLHAAPTSALHAATKAYVDSAAGGGSPTPNALTFNNSGSGAASGTSWTGSVAQTISYNTIGAPSATGTGASGTWSISVTGSAGSAGTATNAGTLYNGAARLSAETYGTNWPQNGTRIRGGFTTADINQRAYLQTNSTDASTYVGIVPNGTAGTSAIQVLTKGNDPSTASVGSLTATADGSVALAADRNGTGAYLALKIKTGGVDAIDVSPTDQRVYITSTGNYPLALRETTMTAGHWAVGPDSSASFNVKTSGGSGMYMVWGATAWTATSDARLKTDLKPISGAIAKVASLRAMTGRYVSDDTDTSRAFLIAQDFERVLPEAVSKDADGYLGLRYTEVIPLLVAAIKDLSAQVDALKAA